MSLLAPQYQADFDRLAKDHKSFLAKYGVILPADNSQKALVLTYLYKNVGTLVSLEDVRKFVRIYTRGSQDIQPRHLKYDGWNILLSGKSTDKLFIDSEYIDDKSGNIKTALAGNKLPNGFIMLFNTKTPSADFQVRKRRGAIDRSDWKSIQDSYNNKCAVCKEKKDSFEKGHKDPKLGAGLDNIIPMCAECNNWASNNFVFDDMGRIVKLASPHLVLKSDIEVQVHILEELRNNKDINKSRT